MSTEDLELAKRCAAIAGEVLLGFWRSRESLDVATKASGEFVTNADVAAERSIRQAIADARPHDGWLGEESGSQGNHSRRWIVDPLDGTTNFLRGIPHWAVSIALEVEGQLVVGVVYDPLKSEMFAAGPDHGATLNDTVIHESDRETPSVSEALFGTGIPYGDMPHIDDHATDLATLMPHCAGVRRMGSASLDLAYTAAGRLDGFWERRLQLWDIAAGLVLARQAGLVVEGVDPGERPEETGSVVAAPPGLFESLAGALRQRNPA